MGTCPVCRSAELRPLLRRTQIPVHQNRLARSQDEALGVARGDLDLACCTRCALVFNRAFRAELLAYEPGYENDQTASPLFSSHVEERIQAMLRDGVRGRDVMEIGCGNGEFLRRLCRGGGNRGLGLDPVAPAAFFSEGAGVRIEPRPFADEPSRTPVDTVLGRHVIEHVAEPAALLRLIRQALAPHPEARVYLETPGFEWILENVAVWDLFYEHASYFSQRSLRNALAIAGLRMHSLERVFGEQYLWASAAPAPASADVEPPSDEDLAGLDRFAAREASEVRYWRDRVDALAAAGEVAVWGAGAKGATFLHLVDPDRARIAVVVDLHPNKQGRYVAGTGHAVSAPRGDVLRAVRSVIVMNPNYRTEVEQRIGDLGLAAHVYVAEGR
jgi:SAM-dependent methyltransferase